MERENDVWKDVVGYEGHYKVSSLGRVMSCDKVITRKDGVTTKKNGVIKKPQITNKGYYKMFLYKNGNYEQLLVHRIVAEAFLENPNNYPCVNHKDENPKNNSLKIDADGNVVYSNLEWCTYKYNSNYGTSLSRIAEKISIPVDKLNLKGEYVCTYKSAKEASNNKPSLQVSITACCKGKIASAGGFKWRYANESIRCEPKKKRIFVREVRQIDGSEKVVRSYKNASDAGKYFGKNAKIKISECCRGVRQSAYGYKWEYVKHEI